MPVYLMLAEAGLLVVAVSVDAFVASFSYGINCIRIPCLLYTSAVIDYMPAPTDVAHIKGVNPDTDEEDVYKRQVWVSRHLSRYWWKAVR